MNKWLLILFYFCWLNLASAVEVTDLYQAKIAVESQSSKERSQAIREALKAVVIKVGGQKEALESSEIKRAVRQFNSYLTQYSYERDEQGLKLIANFNEAKINTLFQQANLPLWGNLRPQIIVWLIEEQGLSRDILPESADSRLPTDILDFSQQRGLPLVLPLMDLDDQLSVSTADIWGRFAQEVKLASARYFVDASLVIRISNSSLVVPDETAQTECVGVLCQDTETYVLDWSLVGERQQFSESYQGENKTVLLNQALEDVAHVIYQQYASSTDLSNELVIDVANVDTLKTYVNIVQFLEDLSTVESVTLLHAEQQKRTFKLSLLGSKQALIASLKLIDELEQYIDPLAPPKEGEHPIFYWRRR